MAFDFSADACASYEANLGVRPVQIDARELLRMARAGWSPGRLDLLVADPPCAPWSRAGKRQGLDDERDMLVTTIELITLLRPRSYLLGNIPGLEDAPNRPVVQRLIGGLAKHGYCVVDFTVLDAVDYGVPQFRARPFWYGHLDGPCLVWPQPTHGDPRTLHQHTLLEAPLLPWVTCRDALGHLSPEELGRPVRLRPNPRHQASAGAQPAKTITAKVRGNGGQAVDIQANAKHPHNELDEPAVCITSGDGGGSKRVLRLEPSGDARPKRDPSTRGPQSARVGNPDAPAMTLDARVARVGSGEAQVLAWSWGPGGDPPTREQPLMGERLGDPDAPSVAVIAKPSRVGAGAATTLPWPWPRPSTTVFSNIDKLAPPGRSGSHGDPQCGHHDAIVLSESAAAILQGFPPGWVFVGTTKKARWAQLGMAVPRLLAAAIGRSVARARRLR